MLTKLNIICTILMAVLPYSIYRIHKKIIEYGMQPWKRNTPKGNQNE
ncbi:hypothetical protein [Bacillus manliponensis]|nr:hypothetical protein [Bacillus manliponensis]